MPATTAFAARRPWGRCLWSGLSLRFTRLPSSLYTFHARAGEAWLGITVPLSRLRLPRIWQILRAHLRRRPSLPELECDTLATLLWRSYGEVLLRLRSQTYRQAEEILLAPVQERFDEQQASELCLTATARAQKKATSDSGERRSLRAMRLLSQPRRAGFSPSRPRRQVIPHRPQTLLEYSLASAPGRSREVSSPLPELSLRGSQPGVLHLDLSKNRVRCSNH